MASLLKNTAGQHMTFAMVSFTSGAADASATITTYITIDNAAQITGSGTITNKGNGQYDYQPLQSETNGTDLGFLFTASGDIPVSLDFHTG